MSDTRICRECGLESYWHATAHERKSDLRACNTLRSAVVGYPPEELGVTPYTVDSELAHDLYPIFAALVTWSRKAGRTEINAERAAEAALWSLGVSRTTLSAIRRRYTAGS